MWSFVGVYSEDTAAAEKLHDQFGVYVAASCDELKANNIPVTGGSMCMFANYVQELKKAVKTEEYGKVLGGFSLWTELF